MENIERYLDGYELSLLQIWITLRGELTTTHSDTLAALRDGLPSILDKYSIGHITVEGGFPGARFARAQKPATIEARDWDDTTTTDVVTEAYTGWSSGQPLVGAYVAQRGTSVQLTVCASHSICDGRTIEGIYRIFAHVLDESVPLPADAPLPPFSKADLYPGVSAAERAEAPASWAAVPTNPPILPPLPEASAGASFRTVATYVRYAYPPIQRWCREHSVGVQALLTAAEARAHRAFNGMPADEPLWVATPVDTRTSPAAAPALAARELLNGSGMAFVRVDGRATLLEEAEGFQKEMGKCLRTTDACRYPLFFGALVDEKTGNFVPRGGCPTFCETPLMNASNVGGYRYVRKPRMCPLAPAMPGLGFYTLSLYCYRDEEILEAFVLHPDVMEHKLLEMIISNLDEAFALAGSSRV